MFYFATKYLDFATRQSRKRLHFGQVRPQISGKQEEITKNQRNFLPFFFPRDFKLVSELSGDLRAIENHRFQIPLEIKGLCYPAFPHL